MQNPIAHREIDGNVIETGWDVFNVALDIASLGANLATGNYVDAAIDAGGLLYDGVATVLPGLPGGAGAIIKASRAGKAAIKVIDKIQVGNRVFQSAIKADKYKAIIGTYGTKVGSAIWDAGKGGANKLAKVLGTTGTGKAAHHIIPTDVLSKNDYVQKAVNEGFDFNSAVNGIPLDATRHSGGHGNYNKAVEEMVNGAFTDKANKGKSATEILKGVIGNLKLDIKNSTGKIDDLYKKK